MAIVLPKPREIVPATAINPDNLFLFGPPKVGKTEICCQFTQHNNALLIDIDPRQGSRYQAGTRVWASTLKDLGELGKAIRAAGRPYERIILDTITDLQALAVEKGISRYSRSSLRDPTFNPERDDIQDLPWGAGQRWIRGAFADFINEFNYLAHGKLILVGHVKDAELVDKEGVQKVATLVHSGAIDLIGKVKAITCSNVDSIGYLYRKTVSDGTQRMFINFRHSAMEDIVCGNRCPHLVTMNEEFDWNKIFLRDEKGNIL